MELFKGYLPTINKKSLIKFSEAKSFDEVKKLNEYAGLLNDDVILIDIDNQEQSEILMKIVEDFQLDCRVYQTTRGRHFLFKNEKVLSCHTNTKLVCGLTADIKVGSKNSYEVLKFDGKDRFIEWDIEDDGSYQVIPNFLLPVKTNISLFNLGEGDGRNSALYEYILTLNQIGIPKQESKEILKLINKYIFKTELKESEIDIITRDEAFPKDTFFNKKGTFLHNEFAQFLINEKHIVRINGQIHIYKEGIYVSGLRDIESAMLNYIPILKSSQRTEILKYIELVAKDVKVADSRYIAFKNGIYNVFTDELTQFSSDMIITNQIPWDYNPSAYSKICDQILNKISCNDVQIRSLLEECIGYCFYRRNEMSKAFILTGEKSNGKSTFLEMIKNVLGNDNVSSLDIGELEERFSVAEMAGKLANIGDDVSDEFMQGRSIATFKKIVSGNSIKAEFKGENVFFFSPYIKLLFSANSIPRTKDKTGAVLRRLIIIPFNATFTENDSDYDPYIIYKLKDTEVMEYLVSIGITALKRILKQRKFSYSESVNKAVNEYEIENNPILSFLEEVKESEIENQLTDEVYRRYKVFCIENGYSEMTKITFSKELNRKLGLVTKSSKIDGAWYRIYAKCRHL